MNASKQSVGIDISKKSFTACICTSLEDEKLTFSEVRTFNNECKGFNQLTRWVARQHKDFSDAPLVFLMEATGVFHESLTYYLYEIKKTVHVVLPNTSKHYFSSLNIKTKTDKLDAQVLARFGVERKHKAWIAPDPSLLEIRNLTRYYVQLLEQKTALNNIKLHKESAHDVQAFILRSNTSLIKQLDKQIERCKKEIERLIHSNQKLKIKVEKLLTIKGVGLITIATIIAETQGFSQITNAKQLASYAGYDVVHRESGSSIKGKSRISKKGNRYIRNALYFPAMVACRFNPDLKKVYLRIVKKKASKMIAQVAIQRKLLVLIYTLWKNGTTYIEDYQNKVAQAESA